MMRVIFLIWFLFVSCTQAISSSDLQRNFSSEQRGLNSLKSNMQRQQSIEKLGSIEEALRLQLHRKDEERNNEEKYELFYDSRKAHKGKGAYGGADVNHRPRRPENSAISLLSSISTVYVSFALILVFSFHLRCGAPNI